MTQPAWRARADKLFKHNFSATFNWRMTLSVGPYAFFRLTVRWSYLICCRFLIVRIGVISF